MIEGEELAEVKVNSDWEAEAGPGCELTVHTRSGNKLFVIRTGIPSTDEEVAAWEDKRLGKEVAATHEITRWPLGTGGEQVTLEVELEDGFTFEADLILPSDEGAAGAAPDVGEDGEQPPADGGDGQEEIETEWVFEGRPGEEMGER